MLLLSVGIHPLKMCIHQSLRFELFATVVFADEPSLVMDLKHVFFELSLLFESKLVSDLILRK